MSKSSGGKVPVNEYRMSMLVGLAVEVDAVLEIKIREKTAWQGERNINGSFRIDKPDLFGGVKKEGGVAGTVYLLKGGPTQKMPTFLAQRFHPNLTTDTCPAFRNRATLFFIGNPRFDPSWAPTPGVTDGTGTGGGGGTEAGWSPPGGFPDDRINEELE